jgi:glycosyltransferase involved in cell wall biosynthesis
MKIAQVISTPPFAWATGGCARVAYELSIELANLGHDVTILTTDLYEPNKRQSISRCVEHINGIKILRFKYLSDRLAWKHKFYLSLELMNHIWKNLQFYDIVHLQDLISPQAVITASCCKRYNIPYVLTTHGSASWLSSPKYLNSIYRKLFGNTILKNASKIFALNNDEVTALMDLGVPKKKINIVPNGLNLLSYDLKFEKNIFKSKYNLYNQKIILYLGRIHESKGINLLIEAFADICSERNDITLILAGPDDGYRSTSEMLINDLGLNNKVLFTGYIDDNTKGTIYVDADVFVTPVFLGFPVTFLEASFYGVPIVATNFRDELDWIHDNVGYVTDYNKEDLKDAILHILDDERLRERFSIAGQKIVLDRYNWSSIAIELEKYYLQCISHEGL